LRTNIIAKFVEEGVDMNKGKFMDVDKLMVKLSFTSYLSLFGRSGDIKQIIGKALKQIDPYPQTLVWGPVIGSYGADQNVALVYISKFYDSNTYNVVVRGTNPFSLISWWFEDLIVWEKVPWQPGSPSTLAQEAKISNATATSLNIHLNLTDKDLGSNLIDFLKSELRKNNLTINFTGHSLGGLMAPTLALKFYETLDEELLGKVDSINTYAFAGPTAGDSNFVKYMESVFRKETFKDHIFFRNDHDVAVRVWNTSDMKQIFDFYDDDGVPVTSVLKFIVGGLTATVEGLEYKQPSETMKKVPQLLIDIKEKLNLKDLKDIHLEHEFGLIGHRLLEFAQRIGLIKKDALDVTFFWLLMAQLQHIFAYLEILDKDDANYCYIKNDIMKPLIYRAFPGKQVRNLMGKI
jgi:hypothetical protein